MTRFKLFLLLFCWGVVVSGADVPQSVKGVINASRLNVRVKPGTSYTVVAKLKRGAEVRVVSMKNDWCQIIAPGSASVWVAGRFLKDGKATRSVKLRSGPGIAYQPYAQVPAGTVLKVVEFADADWVKVAPLPFLTAWVAKRFIECDEKQLELMLKPPVKKVVENKAGDKKSEKNSKPENKITIPFVKDTEQEVTLEGIIFPLKKDTVYVTHALVKEEKGKYIPLCYLHSNGNRLDVWKERKVKIKGTRRLVRDWKLPVVEIEKVIPNW
jgi:uncharacterized protein YgiM (DUF1202 family)